MRESTRWPWASTRSCSGRALVCASMVADLVSKLLGYPLLEGKLDFEPWEAQEVAILSAEGGAVLDGDGSQVSVND